MTFIMRNYIKDKLLKTESHKTSVLYTVTQSFSLPSNIVINVIIVISNKG